MATDRARTDTGPGPPTEAAEAPRRGDEEWQEHDPNASTHKVLWRSRHLGTNDPDVDITEWTEGAGHSETGLPTPCKGEGSG